MRKPLTEQELHNLAMNIVGKQLEEDGYEFLAVNSKPKKNPQFVCLKEKQISFILVRSVTYPEDPKKYDAKLMEKIKKHGEKFEAKAFYAGVGLSNSEDQQLPVYLDEDYIMEYDGLIEV